jgi:hypothetical protein
LALVAFVAVTVHVPGVVAANVVPPVMEHPAVPALVTANVTAPVPDPPDDVNAMEDPYVPLVEDTVNVDCDALPTVSAAVFDVTAVDKALAKVFVTMTLKDPASVNSKELMTKEELVASVTATPPFNHW